MPKRKVDQMIEVAALITSGVICRYCGVQLDHYFRGFPRCCTTCKIEHNNNKGIVEKN